MAKDSLSLKDKFSIKNGKMVMEGTIILSKSRYQRMLEKDMSNKTKAIIGFITALKCARYYLAEYIDPKNNKTIAAVWHQAEDFKSKIESMLKAIMDLPMEDKEQEFLKDITTCQAGTAKYILDVLRSLRTEESMDALFILTADKLIEIIKQENALVESKLQAINGNQANS